MSRFAYVNGSYVPFNQASVHIEDRGFQFADAVYEVVYLHKGRLIDMGPHLDRLGFSLNELSIEFPISRAALILIIKELVRKNRLSSGLIYIQVSRGRAVRDFPFPKNIKPTLVMTARRAKPFDPQTSLKPLSVISLNDQRWKRCDIKTVSLLAAAMAKQSALDSGVDDAWMLDEQGYITEGTSNNAWIVHQDGHLQTRPPSHDILNGITRRCILELAENKGLKVLEEPFTLEEVKNAREAFITSASKCIAPVTQIDSHLIAGAKIGTLTQQIAASYEAYLLDPTQNEKI